MDSSFLRYNYHEVPKSKYTDSTTHTYRTVGIFDVSQQGNFSINGGISTIVADTIENYINVRSVQVPKLVSFPCANNSVSILANDPQYDKYVVFANGTEVIIPKFQSQTIALTSPVPSALKSQGAYEGLCRGDTGTVAITTYPILNPPKVSSLSVISEQQIELSFQAEKYHRYEIGMRTGLSGPFQKIDTLEGEQGPIKYPISNLFTTTTNYCVQIRAMDYCGQRTDSVEVCSVILTGNAQNEQNNIQWTDYPNSLSSDYSLVINGQTSTTFASRPSKTTYIDTSIVCGEDYCYVIKTTLPSGVVSNSNSLCLKAVSTSIPPTVQGLSSTVLGGKIQLSWQPSISNPTFYSIYGPSNTLIGTSKTSSFTDPTGDPSKSQFCYKVGYSNNCGKTALLSESTCPIFLNGKVNSALSRSVTWQPYVSWPEGLKEYIVEKVNENGVAYFSQSVGAATSFSDSLLDTVQQIIYYRITAVSNTGAQTYSNVWKAEQQSKIYFPNAFTPNGDGLNDSFHPVGLFVGEFKLEIWNRNGEGMFSTSSINEGWDGNVNGQRAPVDTYMYKWEGKDKTGKAFKAFPGTVQLIR